MTGRTLAGRVAVVTGGGRGIGREIALSLAREGASVVVNAMHVETGTAAATAEDIVARGGKAVAHYGDVASFDVAGQLIEEACAVFGSVEILVNNAGIFGYGLPWSMSEGDWDEMIRTDLKSAFNCTRHVTKLMKEQRWGRIINCTSGSWINRAAGCHYAAAKAGIVGFTRAVAMDMAPYDVTCNAYHPYAMTDLLKRSSQYMGQARYTAEERFKQGKIDREEYEWQLNPPGPEGVGPLVSYLASPAAGGISGKVFYVSGGKIAVYSEPERIRTMNKRGETWSVGELIESMPALLS